MSPIGSHTACPLHRTCSSDACIGSIFTNAAQVSGASATKFAVSVNEAILRTTSDMCFSSHRRPPDPPARPRDNRAVDRERLAPPDRPPHAAPEIRPDIRTRGMPLTEIGGVEPARRLEIDDREVGVVARYDAALCR